MSVLFPGVGLMEIVTEPDMKSGAEAAAFVKELRQILMAIHTCDGNIQGTYKAQYTAMQLEYFWMFSSSWAM